MAVPKSIQASVGDWKGKSKLNLPYLPPEEQVTESESTLRVSVDGTGAFATITYTWSHDGNPQEGTILLVRKAENPAVELAWVDSWHQHESILYMKGEEAESGSVRVEGSWPAGDEMWGWTIELVLAEASLVLKMEVVQPNGEATWAVEGTYSRT